MTATAPAGTTTTAPPALDAPGPLPFSARHTGPDAGEAARMLAAVGVADAEELVRRAVPAGILDAPGALDLPPALDESSVTAALRELAGRNRVVPSMIGLGYHGTRTPAVVRRNVLEDPSWYTAYTPYQPEISQGRLEALLNFQTAVADLTGLAVANASLLDEGTAAAEAMALARRVSKAPAGAVFAVDADVLPQTLAVLRTRAVPVGIELVTVDLDAPDPLGVLGERALFGLLVQYPGTSGRVRDLEAVVAAAKGRGAVAVAAADLLALALLRAPGEFGVDVAVGSAQRFGVPMFAGGPHAAFMAVRAGLERSLPGRLVGVSKDADGAPAYRLALQTREQHIRRDRATSNICTAQVLLAVMAGCYAVHHGPRGLRAIAAQVAGTAARVAASLRAGGVEVVHEEFFDTVLARVPGRAREVVAAALAAGVNLRLVDGDHVGLTCDETTTAEHVSAALTGFSLPPAGDAPAHALPAPLLRTSPFLTHPVFSKHRSETAMLRYLRRLSDADYALDRGMIPLGSCTMKLNATTELEPVSWPEFADLHPYAPADQLAGTAQLVADLERWLAEVTGYDAVSLQPNAGSQGEFAGLLAIRAHHRSRGEAHRTVCLIPSSAHGTNAASAVMAGLRVVVVACDGDGNVDLDDLRTKVSEHADDLAAIMVTYPSTHGVYEESIREVCALVHDAGGQVYVDGANLNALVGLARPGRFGADVSHLNLHKTFCVPHGGGGPGVGPVAVRAHLAPFLPATSPDADPERVGMVSAAPFGSAGILPISWAYVRLMGADGLRAATVQAVLSANYVAARLREAYPVLYRGPGGLVAHECVLDLRPMTRATGVTVEDVAKRLIDFGFHAPTMSFPVAGTLMVEPTESEDLAEVDRFCDAMLAVAAEVREVERGRWAVADSPLRHAPHTAASLAGDWDHPYTREEAVYPGGLDPRAKYWPPVRRIDGATGDRNLVCSCPPLEELAEG
ncbi:aminomethyl-transferring glycine dehydrogenase [Paenibacillus sp. TRM 82003]|uniref:aminomethyl-transferring glycine dehydrogenase n=1 Tax=Kineococcus sp. TRM81007 TaxID=2925831 RepID=UPI001F55BBA7|nr:aminomethyl-transferring glycine dehydrogenase [Kineococcus sp. TRM81007]MCI2240661.1 aminomethyl-transferring glycine dehydrogenase [Kineococcus sp. TRM81007]MCI3925416.1 aminomethyl-transferring glycine dehydrogenase [Paenibacillus sp. TRM 82003]